MTPQHTAPPPRPFTPEFRLMLAVNSASLAGFHHLAAALRGLLPEMKLVGEIRDVRIWDRALSEREIRQEITRPRHGECALPLDLYDKLQGRDANFYPL